MRKSGISPGLFEPCCLATTIGSLPHTDVARGVQLVFDSTPELPGWPQFPKRSFNENMIVQFTEGVPGLRKNGERLVLDTTAPGFVEEATDFYGAYLAVTESDDPGGLAHFGVSPEYAAGFTAFLNRLQDRPVGLRGLKGQITGPFTQGINTRDQKGRCAYYDDQLRDILVKAVAMKGLWQIRELKPFCELAIVLIDEPSLLNFGSQMFLTVDRGDIIRDLNEVASAIHSAQGLAGVHCEANTDWSILMETDLDILVFDAYDHMQGMTLYPRELEGFLERGGSLGWGIVPTLDREAAGNETLDSLLARFEDGLERLLSVGLDRTLLLRRALITPSCGMGGVLTEPLAERVLVLLRELSEELRSRYGFPA